MCGEEGVGRCDILNEDPAYHLSSQICVHATTGVRIPLITPQGRFHVPQPLQVALQTSPTARKSPSTKHSPNIGPNVEKVAHHFTKFTLVARATREAKHTLVLATH